MQKDIQFGGQTANPSGYSCPDGDLDLSLNLINEDGALRPLEAPEPCLILANAEKVLLIHKVQGGENFILLNFDSLSWLRRYPAECVSSADAIPIDTRGPLSGVRSVVAIGNTLCIATEKGVVYVLWKEGDYKCLGSALPEIQLRFSLQGSVFDSVGPGRVDFESTHNAYYFSDSERHTISDAVIGAVNKFVASRHKMGEFVFPFFVRYAFRLFDGSLTRQSPPVLLTPAFGPYPVCRYDISGQSSVSASHAYFYVGLISSRLKSHFPDMFQTMSALQPWLDIISSVEIFVSAPVYTFDVSAQLANPVFGEDAAASLNSGFTFRASPDSNEYPQLRSYKNEFNGGKTFDTHPALPYFSAEEMQRKLQSVSNFYLIKSIPLSSLASYNGKVVEIEEDVLSSIVARETLPDDYDSHDVLAADLLFAYNSRLNLASITKSLCRDYDPFTAIAPAESMQEAGDLKGVNANAGLASVTAYTYISNSSGRYILKHTRTDIRGFQFPFFYHPCPDAYQILFVFEITGSSSRYFVRYDLKRHEFLNGAFIARTLGELPRVDLKLVTDSTPIPADADCVSEIRVPILNKVYTSEVNNPFHFPLANISTVGAGQILGLSSAAKALSQGQFGQFPLYAFTDEGVWALEVASSGVISARQPITRDVCSSPEGITQIDSAVLFPTDRGIMLLSGSQTQCISAPVDSPSPLLLSDFRGLSPLIASGSSFLPDTAPGAFPEEIIPFRSYVRYSCRMAYDYAHQHIIVFSPSYPYFYVYSLKSQSWCMARGSLDYAVNSYPEALVADTRDRILDFSAFSGSFPQGVALSRPIKLGMPDVLKTVSTVIQRGLFRRGTVRCILYGSRDLFNWFPVWSSQDHFLRGFSGSPYKYFRIALSCGLGKDETVYGATFQYEPRLTNQPR